MTTKMQEIVIPVLENELTWSMRAIDHPEEALTELNALKAPDTNQASIYSVQAVENSKLSED
jgi:hypothetical protein